MKSIFKIISIFCFIFSGFIYAEDCSYIDCPGYVGYVYVSSTVIYPPKLIRRGRQDYSLEGLDELLFVESGLPDINSVVTIANNQTSFYWPRDIPNIAINLAKHEEYVLNEDAKVATANPFFERSFLMDKGSKVKILGYTHFPIKGIEDKLFALILYVSDPEK